MTTQSARPTGYIYYNSIDKGTKKEVYRAFDLRSKSWKILKRFLESPSQEMLDEELRPLARLNHQNIVTQDPPQFIGDEVWIIEEVLDQTFDDLAPLDHRYGIAVYCHQIAMALTYLHDPDEHGGRAIVHGDIHLKNCGLVRGVAKLFDFGQATYADSTNPKARGYVCTRSPEQFRGDRSVHQGLDVWSFACTIYGLRTGEYPFVLPSELEEYRAGGEARARLDGELALRTSQGLDNEVAQRLRPKFDETLWSLLDSMLAPREDRVDAAEVEKVLSNYRTATTQVTGNGGNADDASRLAVKAKDAMERGDVRSLGWFRDAVEEELSG